jgi:NADPH:quinone reductase-like Zn-dependent oxidoreductase
MVASVDERLKMIEKMQVTAIDRREFMDMNYNDDLYKTDRDYKKKYLKAENAFLSMVNRHTEDNGVSIFIDNIGEPVHRATIRALGRQGVVTTVGWKLGMNTSFNRAVECISRHIHVFTHGSKYIEGVAAMHFAEETGWMAPLQEHEKVYSWNEIPELAKDYAENKIISYFPVFQINPL